MTHLVMADVDISFGLWLMALLATTLTLSLITAVIVGRILARRERRPTLVFQIRDQSGVTCPVCGVMGMADICPGCGYSPMLDNPDSPQWRQP